LTTSFLCKFKKVTIISYLLSIGGINVEKPMVSVCIPVYNGENSIAITIQDVLAQSFTNFELIIIDDASKDRTEDIIMRFNDSRIRYYKNSENIGMVKNWNKAISFAEGKYVKLLSMDDLIEANCLEKQVEALENNPTAVMVTSNTYIIDTNSNVLMIRKNFAKEGLYNGYKIAKSSLVFGKNIFGEPSVVLYRREILKETGFYDDNFWYAPDWDFCIRILSFGNLYFTDKALAAFRLSPSSQTSKIINKNKWVIMKEDMRFLSKHSRAIHLNIFQKTIHYTRMAFMLVAKYIYLRLVFRKRGINARAGNNTTLEYQRAHL
jgi:glycosyltransferase involved in cell wall biosynthesis